MIQAGFRPLVMLLAAVLLAALAACGAAEDAADERARQHVDAMSREHAADDGSPNAAADVEPSREVIAETLPYAEVDEELVYGYFVFPADMVEPLPAVIMIHEWWGLNDGVRSMADRLAAEGYIVLAVDLFGGSTTTSPAGARAQMIEVVEAPELANDNLRQAFEFLRDTAGAPAIASLGWCFGGGWSLNTALLFPEQLAAAVIYYGQVIDDEDRLRTLEMPLLGIFAEDDRGIPLDSVRAFEAALTRLRKDYEIRVYADVEHAFANPSGTNYDATAAEEAWAVTLAFLDEHLNTGTESP